MSGRSCMWCEEPITHEERAESTIDGYHHECAVRTIVGSVGHQMRRCSCYVPGSEDDDPPGLSRRDAALAALAIFKARSSPHRTQA